MKFGVEHAPIVRHWHAESQYLILLAVADEAALVELRDRVENQRIPLSEFKEPDFGYSLTAIAIAPGERTSRLLSALPLALREEANV